MNTQMTLAEAASWMRPQVAPMTWQVLLLLFITLLRKLGFLPSDGDDDQYTSYGTSTGFEMAAQDAHNRINAMPGDPNAKQMMHQTVDYWRTKYQTGNVSLV